MVLYKEFLSKLRECSPSVELVAVSKTKTVEDIKEAYREGSRVFGENRVQEINEKFPLLNLDEIKVYLIGQLQRNKVKKAVSLVDRIESVDSIPLLIKIDEECKKIDKKMDILFEVNSSHEEQKSGFKTKEELFSAVLKAQELTNVNLIGLMTVGPLGGDRAKNIAAFTYTKSLFDEISKSYPLSVLSMGMSGDWKEAIESGSTEIRIGSSIFGVRG